MFWGKKIFKQVCLEFLRTVLTADFKSIGKPDKYAVVVWYASTNSCWSHTRRKFRCFSSFGEHRRPGMCRLQILLLYCAWKMVVGKSLSIGEDFLIPSNRPLLAGSKRSEPLWGLGARSVGILMLVSASQAVSLLVRPTLHMYMSYQTTEKKNFAQLLRLQKLAFPTYSVFDVYRHVQHRKSRWRVLQYLH